MAEHYCQRIPDPIVLRLSKVENDTNVCGKPARFTYQFKDLFVQDFYDPEDEEIYHLCADCYDFIHVWNEI